MAVKITKIEMPETSFDWGIVQINNFSNTYYRFGMINGKPKLDTTFFADQLENPKEKHRNISPESDLYKDIQQLLNNYLKENENE
ncbi:hypothetical protein LG329_19335 (plasmid) [Virgibacillus necropolis]|uniref:hypothetical protein n=1 Tax=Virgibacillus necropolis TaxID=163877 RepID=UPI00384E2F83